MPLEILHRAAPCCNVPVTSTLGRSLAILSKFSWDAIDDVQFEELLLELVNIKGAVRANLRTGPGGKGRDVEAYFRNRDALGVETEERYFFEAKHHAAGVSPDHIAAALAWAQAECPSCLVIAATSHLTNPCRDLVEGWSRNNPRVRTVVWERKDLENQILGNALLCDIASGLRLLPPNIRSLLPEHPERYRPSHEEEESGLEMNYRFWLTAEDVDQLELVAKFVEDCGAVFVEHDIADHHFELARLGVPNWAMWLRLMRTECMLQLAVRDYLFAQAAGAEAADLHAKADHVRNWVRVVEEAGRKSFHVD